jgi:hypothetical protein
LVVQLLLLLPAVVSLQHYGPMKACKLGALKLYMPHCLHACRSNQQQPPIYKIVSTNICGEHRFASAVAHRLQQLGALTQGDRRAASASEALASFNLQTRCVHVLVCLFGWWCSLCSTCWVAVLASIASEALASFNLQTRCVRAFVALFSTAVGAACVGLHGSHW